MISLILLLFFSLHAESIEPILLDLPGCPDNSVCTKETGAVRLEWLEILKNYSINKIDEKETNKQIQKKSGFPIPSWATEAAKSKPMTTFWDSPCKQHQKENEKTYIAITFLKNLLPKNKILFHSPAILTDDKSHSLAIQTLRGEIPLLILNDSLYFTQVDDGYYYGLLISYNGKLSFSKVIKDTHYPKEITCTTEQINLFTKELPSKDFFKGYYCKAIWNLTTKTYNSLIFGWSCN